MVGLYNQVLIIQCREDAKYMLRKLLEAFEIGGLHVLNCTYTDFTFLIILLVCGVIIMVKICDTFFYTVHP
ncbi:hypothetical protein ANN_18769 [Periplaneta americana]|uniref:Uncharacterized protein n=1 Tax=Periplaneta americana TaxID=6978 RepID=A0ABQ8SR34_PERAM|nr:hypothetical protein ANN_18769 [Periplaneta americana]